MNLEQRREVDYLRRDLHALEREEEELKNQLERIIARKNDLLERINKNTDDKMEEDALQRLYEQRRNRK